jgi:N-acetylneuraminate synthase
MKPYIIAEIGLNHEGNKEWAYQMIDECAGLADAVKFQIYTAETLAHPSAKNYWGGKNTQLQEYQTQLSIAEGNE